MVVLKYYCEDKNNSLLLNKLHEKFSLENIGTELCFYVNVAEDVKGLSEKEELQLIWLLSTPFHQPVSQKTSFVIAEIPHEIFIEIGPRLNFSTAFSTNAVSICNSVGLTNINRIEVSRRYLVKLSQCEENGLPVSKSIENSLVDLLCDKMTQCRYEQPIESFDLSVITDDVYEVDILTEGQAALEKANKILGLAFDDWDLKYYTELFQNKVKRNPTSVECFDLAQSNSEHSRHWFFKGEMIIDGERQSESLFDLVMSTQDMSNKNNIISFSDNSSAIAGSDITFLRPTNSDQPSMIGTDTKLRHIIFTAETHNFPTGVAPFPGATTGSGGRIRDVHATGRGAHVVAGTAGYCFGNLNIPGYDLPWEEKGFPYPSNFATPLEIAIEASNGASDYGNKFGEPIVTGFARSFGMKLLHGERREYIKPVMFSGGIGLMDDAAKRKQEAEIGMDVIKIGGPVYRIGVGGGAASSVQVQGDNSSELDFGAVQRGDAEMEQKLNRVIRACIEYKSHNPILSIHDQGAGGNGNVLKEITEPAGALIRASQFQLGDPTISILELWGAEYQENTAVLVSQLDRQLLKNVAKREKCPVCFVGEITGDKKIRLEDDRQPSYPDEKKNKCRYPVDLNLELVLGKMPKKKFHLSRVVHQLQKLNLPQTLNVNEALERVLRLPSVGSKRYLTNKVDRSVTGLVAQQQCVGPLHTPLADVGVIALSHFTTMGGATAIGEQPIKGLVNPVYGARMTVGEALTNLVFAPITDLKDVKCSGNWMWPAKLPGEGALLYDTCAAMSEVMKELGVAVDGGKDSLSMAARVGSDTVKAPGTLVVSVYALCTDITAILTPDLKCPRGKGVLLYVPLNCGQHRLGGSALAQCFKQIGDDSPNLDDASLFIRAYSVTQQLIKDKVLISGHDVSDGGLITCILEMAFAGNCGLTVDVPNKDSDLLGVLFAEELGLVLEADGSTLQSVLSAYGEHRVDCFTIGTCQPSADNEVNISVNGQLVIKEKVSKLRDIWEDTSFHLEQYQVSPDCVTRERESLLQRSAPDYCLTFKPKQSDILRLCTQKQSTPHLYRLQLPQVAIIREEGSNGDREMAAAFMMAGFETWDVNMQDLAMESITLDRFQGLVFVGGFSYADVFGSAKGWAATLKFNQRLKSQFEAFYRRPNTFSLGVCNGCQLMALLGWIASTPDTQCAEEEIKPCTEGVHFTHNLSGRYESRFSTVRIGESPAMMLRGMAGSVLGIWVAHGEGRIVFKDPSILDRILDEQLAPIRYVDDDGRPTELYPMNPNGSPAGIAAVCSPDGRHLAMMPHPERCVLPWQWPWMPYDWKTSMTVSPWLQMFNNAFQWCKSETS
ncbi:hypothetical protein LSH36_14g05035 [Paralvinella palmiformis]|uniref:Phosphoribosylformylglycinamidine synthase n=1 Tax=Paralvinella palmiformis TaxID=53620 RepID=A0AAD9KCG5_9ANNE|nr:hypothetical protein LSH36_14g05035 [Paralvinella palmiformis]